MWQALATLGSAAVGALANRKANKDNEAAQREFAQQGLRWKVEDAKAAGLHPLYALGGSGAAFSPSHQPLFNSQDLSRAAAAVKTDGEREIQAAQLDVLKAQAAKDYALAAAADSRSARDAQANNTAVSFPVPDHSGIRMGSLPTIVREMPPLANVGGGRGGNGPGARSGLVSIEPDKQVSANPAWPESSAGTHTFFQEYQLQNGLRIELPRSDEGPSESLDSISWWQWPGIIAANMQRYGAGWLDDAIQKTMLPRVAREYIAEQRELLRRHVLNRKPRQRGGAGGSW